MRLSSSISNVALIALAVLGGGFPVTVAGAQAGGAAAGAQPNTLTAAERAAGWRLLFDGTTT
jgi:hypothetical protein